MAKRRNSSARGQTSTKIRAHGTITKPIVTPDMVEDRARELALIAGREPSRVTASDRIQAKKELLGDDSADSPVDDIGITPSGMGSPPTSTGKMTKPQLPTDDEIEVQTVQEGLDQAEHDEMLQAAKTRTKNEG
ncbi:MAG TPA: hypothetical protein VGY98_13210 [Verrucomicrobiae bacterium]|nr:hypothetical protein [Verrucomicrobiae bacterium]